MARPPVLIESWLPIEAVGAESKRERGASSALPPLYFLHVWWARRPLIASRAAILAGVLPQWSPDFPSKLHQLFPDEDSYHEWFLRLIGILGDPVNARARIDWEKSHGLRTNIDKYGYSRAYTSNPSLEDLQILGDLLNFTWRNRKIRILDPFAGGGSIPFEALRYGFDTLANDLNPVSAIILKATLEYPASFGPLLVEEIQKWANRWYELVKPRLEPFFSAGPNKPKRTIYMWARTVACPTTGKPVPLAPNWWISRNPPIAAKLIAEPHMDEPCFEIVQGAAARSAKPNEGTISRGVGRSPWTGETIDSDYIKAEAQAGRMGQLLYCVEVMTSNGREYIAPEPIDFDLVRKANTRFSEIKNSWISKNLLPTEVIPQGSKTVEPKNYGMVHWEDFYTQRQLLVLGTLVDALDELSVEIQNRYSQDKSNALRLYLGFILEKIPNYNSLLSSWHASRRIVRSVFDRHDFSFKWSFVEFEGENILPWAINQILDAYKGIAELLTPSQISLLEDNYLDDPKETLSISQGSANRLSSIVDNTIENITVDPPYYDNVQYAELSDFFYVWLKRSIGHLFPEFFKDELTNKDDEAVANPARFESMGKKKKRLAEQDYELKMAAAFREMHRVLHPDGVLTVMFTHKRVEAWDTLATALIGAGFIIKASWPVHTESEHSLHQAKKNAAASTILLVCRKRETQSSEPVWWEDIQERVRQVARQKAEEFSQQGIQGVDLYISVFGPTLSILSKNWPVLTSEVDPKTGQPRPLRPETALDLAREEVVRLRKEGLLLGREVQFDPVTDWYLMAWDAFAAAQFPYDEARKLAIALGIDLDGEIKAHKNLAAKKGKYVVLQEPIQRRKKGMVDDEQTTFTHWIDAAHTAMMVYQEDGPGACDAFLQKSGLKRDATFKALLQALINAIPRNRIKSKFARPEAEVLENMRLAFYDDLTAPVEEEPELPAVQMGLWDEPEEDDEQEEE